MARLTVKEAAERMGVSAALVYGLCAARLIRHSRVGLGRGKIFILEEAVEEYLRRREVEAGETANAPPPPKPRLKLRHLQL